MSALLQHNHTSSSSGSMENDLNGISARNDSSITRFSVTGIYHTEFHWSVMAATVAFLCQIFTIYWYRTTLTMIFRQNIWWAIVTAGVHAHRLAAYDHRDVGETSVWIGGIRR